MSLKYRSIMAGSLAALMGLVTIAVDPALIMAEPADVSAEDEAADEGPAALPGSDDEKEIADAVNDLLGEAGRAGDSDKQETVYVFTGADGAVDHVTVSAWLKNPEGADVIEDVSDLTDITNLKGDESYTKDGDKLTWQADGHEIFYQGTSTRRPPVSETITYYLNGEPIAPEDLAGKSGEVRVHIDYVNQVKSGDVYTPFTVAAALVFNNGDVRGVTAEHGSVMTEGRHTIAVSVAFPGLAESLKGGSAKADLTALDIPESADFTMTADSFALPMALTVVLPDVLTEAAGGDQSSLDDLKTKAEDKIAELQDAGGQLGDGATALSEGIQKADEAMPALEDGTAKLADGVTAYTDGVAKAAEGAETLMSGAESAVDPARQLADGVTAYTAGVADAEKGAETLGSGITQMKDGADRLVAGYEDQADGSAGAVSGSAQLASGLSQLNSAVSGLALPEVTLSDEQKQAIGAQAASQTADAAAQMSAGVDSLVSGIASSVRGADASAAAQAVVAASPEIQQAITALVAAGYSEEQAAAVFAGCGAATANAVQNGIADGIEGSDPGASLKSAISGGVGQVASAAAVGGAEGVVSEVQQTMAAYAPQIETLKGSVSALSDGAAALQGGISALYSGTVQLDEALSQAQTGAGALSAGMGLLNQNSEALTAGAGQLSAGVSRIAGGASALNSGLSEITANSDALKSGSAALSDGVKELAEGISKILAGSIELKDGVATFNNEAIDRIAAIYRDDVEGMVDRIDALKAAAASYKSYSGVSDGQSDRVTFIYKSESIG